MATDTNSLHQIHLGVGTKGYERVGHSETPDTATYIKEHADHLAALLRACPESVWPKHSHLTCCPRPILVGKKHLKQLETLHDALVLAITDIVERWWTDTEACFPERMPLAKEEEELLQWLDVQVSKGVAKPFSKCRGSWRPDFLVDTATDGQDGPLEETFRITEINARFSFNGFMLVAAGQQALNSMIDAHSDLVGATDPAQITGGLMDLVKMDRPLHVLKGEELGMDIHMFTNWAQRVHGIDVRHVLPTDLRLVADAGERSGFKLCCIVKDGPIGGHGIASSAHNAGEQVEEIHQVGLELHQRELLSLEPEMLRQLSLRCFNDMRTVLLVHDKRMLGMVKQELPQLVQRKTLTPGQAQALDKGIIETMLPGSDEMQKLLHRCKSTPEARIQYILKPIRSGKGDGIVFGDDVRPEAWLDSLQRLQGAELRTGATYVVQRRIFPHLYDVMLQESGDMVRNPLVGTYHVVNGTFLGLGVWRSSSDRICAITNGGAWMCSVKFR